MHTAAANKKVVCLMIRTRLTTDERGVEPDAQTRLSSDYFFLAGHCPLAGLVSGKFLVHAAMRAGL